MNFKILLDNIDFNATQVATNIVKKRNLTLPDKGLKTGKDIIDLMKKNENNNLGNIMKCHTSLLIYSQE